MNEILGLIIEISFMAIGPLIIPFLLIMIVGNLEYNERIKRTIMLILSIIYNFIIGILSPLLFFCLLFLTLGTTENYLLWIGSLVIVFTILILPLNIFMKRKGKIKIFIYLIGVFIYINNMRGHLNL